MHARSVVTQSAAAAAVCALWRHISDGLSPLKQLLLYYLQVSFVGDTAFDAHVSSDVHRRDPDRDADLQR